MNKREYHSPTVHQIDSYIHESVIECLRGHEDDYLPEWNLSVYGDTDHMQQHRRDKVIEIYLELIQDGLKLMLKAVDLL